jgi:hypothetical protein
MRRFAIIATSAALAATLPASAGAGVPTASSAGKANAAGSPAKCKKKKGRAKIRCLQKQRGK